MKIDNSRSNFDPTAATDRADAARKTDGKSTQTAAAGTSGDAVSVSAQAQLANQAVTAALQACDVRPEVVACAKALLSEGKVGDDAERLADRLIDSMLQP